MNRLYILTLAIVLAVSCQDKGHLDGNGSNPLDNCVISESAQAGMEAVAQWNGFEDSAMLFIKGEDGKEHKAEISVITSSGIIFRIPHGISAGQYIVILEQSGGRQTIGAIEILEPDLPVTGLKVPTVVESGEPFIIEGTGFDSGHRLFLVRDGEKFILDQETVTSGLKITMPENLNNGEYLLYLSNGTSQWLLSDSFNIAVRKVLESVSKKVLLDGDYIRTTQYKASYQENAVKAIEFRSALVQPGEEPVEEAYDRYVLGEDGVFRAEGGSSSSLNINFGYDRGADNNIYSADVLRFSRNNPDGTMRTFTFVYDAAGRPEKVTFVLDGVTRSLQTYFYENENLVGTALSTFAYDETGLKNNPFGADVAMGYDMMVMTDEPFLFFPYLMGEHPFYSRELPSAVLEPTGAMGALEKKIVTYEFDKDGYVVRMSWNGGRSELDFQYR